MRSPSPTRFRFTNRLIEQLPPNLADAKSTEKEYSDADVSGLKCLVGKNGSKKFLLRYTWRGRKRSIALGAYGPLTVQDARGIANEYKGMLSRDEDPKQQKLRTQTALTVEEFAVKHYLPHSASSKRSARNDLSRFTHHVKPAIGSMLLDEVNIQILQQFQNRLMSKLKPATNNRIMALVRHMFNMAVLWGFLEKSPVTGLKLLIENNKRERFLSPAEIKRLFDAADSDQNYYAGQYIKFLLLTGVRRSEAANAKWEDVNLVGERPTWIIPLTKSGKSRTVRLNRLAAELLHNLQRIPGHPYLFPGGNPKKPSSYAQPIQSPSKAFNRMLKCARIENNVTIHTLRHSHAALILNSAGGNLYDVQAALGHSSSRMAERYSHLSNDRLEQTGQQIANCLEQALSPSLRT